MNAGKTFTPIICRWDIEKLEMLCFCKPDEQCVICQYGGLCNSFIFKGDVRKSKHPSFPGNEYKLHPNLLNREFTPTALCKKSLILPTSNIEKSFPVCYLDFKIVEWQLSNSFDNSFVIQAAKRLFEKAKCTNRPSFCAQRSGASVHLPGCQSLLREYMLFSVCTRRNAKRYCGNGTFFLQG